MIGGSVAAMVVAGLVSWYWPKNKEAQKETPTLGSEIFDKTQNQLQGQVPDANPFKDQKNPLDTVYQNPFK